MELFELHLRGVKNDAVSGTHHKRNRTKMITSFWFLRENDACSKSSIFKLLYDSSSVLFSDQDAAVMEILPNL